MAMVFCRGCGKEIHESAPTCPHCGAPQGLPTAGEKAIPDGVKGWSWGAFLLNWIWAIGNRTWIGLLALIPYLGFIMAIVLGIKGREWAWKNKEWESLEHFNRVQRKWSAWALGIVGVSLCIAIIGIVAAIAIPAYHDYTTRANAAKAEVATQEAMAKQQAAEAAQATQQQAEEEMQAKLREAEEKGRRDAEERMRQEQAAAQPAPAQTATTPSATPTAGNLLEKATACANLQACMRVMMEGADPRSPEAIQVAATRIGEFNKAQRGDRKTARDLNKQALDDFRNNNAPSAINLLTKAAETDPADVEIQSNLGFIAIRANRLDIAEQALGKALLLDSRRTSNWLPVAEYFALKGDGESSIRSLLLGYEFSSNKEKTLAFFEDKSTTSEIEAMRPIYVSALQKIRESAR